MNTAGRNRWLAINFAATIFVSAFLLFQVQPLVSKYILPWFGGSPAVWTTCMLFFQTALFGGYAYAHLSQRLFSPRQQALVQLGLIAAALLLLRIVPSESWKPVDSSNPVGRILLLLSASVGAPYFVLSSTGPLVQAWFARAFPGRIPYRLYALSNVGSLLALLSYPFLFERLWDVPQQAGFWSWGFVAYAALCGGAAVSLWMLFRTDRNTVAKSSSDIASAEGEAAGLELAPQGATEAAGDIERASWWRQFLWLVLPAFASVTLLATTNRVCTDVAPIPFLWVVPLSLYLLTFIIAFDHPRWYRPAWLAAITLAAIYIVAAVYSSGMQHINLYECGTPGKVLHWAHDLLHEPAEPNATGPVVSLDFMQYVALNFVAMFGICMLCHGELMRLRPHPHYLTAYYLMISAGGALGGMAVCLLAPQVFTTFTEFPLSLLAGFLLAIVILIRSVYQAAGEDSATPARNCLRWVAVAAGLVVLAIAGTGLCDFPKYFDQTNALRRLAVRNFFGTLSVVEHDPEDPSLHEFTLKHGAITHGTQFTDPERRYKPTTYYGEESGVGRTLGYFRRQTADHGGMRVGAVGLGTGTVAAYVDTKDSISFYEINPAVIAITEPGKWFTYLQDCKERGGKYEIKLGDARLTLERELKEQKPQHYHVLVLDAFSGDAIPVHLLTQEAVEIYLKHLATEEADGEGGAIAVHISNRYLDLEPVVRGVAEKFGLQQIQILNFKDPDNATLRSDWIILTRNKKLADALQQFAVPTLHNRPPAVLWTDARSNLFDVLK